MERTTVHKRNRQKAPWLSAQGITTRTVYFDQRKRLKEARQRKSGSGDYSRESDHQQRSHAIRHTTTGAGKRESCPHAASTCLLNQPADS
jgi:hypothetical protein